MVSGLDTRYVVVDRLRHTSCYTCIHLFIFIEEIVPTVPVLSGAAKLYNYIQ